MKKLLVVSLVIATMALAGLSITAFAHGPDGEGTTPTNEGAWEAMHEACWTGDWVAMTEAAEVVHGEGFGHMPCHGYYASEERAPADPWDGMGGHMGGGMMGWH